MAPHRVKRDLAARRRRVEDEGDEDEGADVGEFDDDDDSSDGSLDSDEDGAADGDRESALPAVITDDSKANGDPASQAAGIEGSANGNGPVSSPTKLTNGTSDMDKLLNGLKLSATETAQAVQFEDFQADVEQRVPSPVVVKTSAHMDRTELPQDRSRREHEEYKKKRDADPAFVPNRGAFFMHDHRHAGPAANGFRPFGRGRGRGGRGGVPGPFGPAHQMSQPLEATDAPWTHDMHEVITEQQPAYSNGALNHHRQSGPSIPPKAAPTNRELSTTKLLGNVQIRVFFPPTEKPILFPSIPVKQYTRLPDHRPPLRRDKPVRISLPSHPPRYIFPSADRSFIFIPRAMRPNQQGFGRGRGRPGIGYGSVGGFSRRTSVFGGSTYGNGSNYTPSVAMSRRSSLAQEVNREMLASPNGSTHPPMGMDPSRPVVKLPIAYGPSGSIEDLSRPQTYAHPQKPTFRENRPNTIPMHQPRPQKTVSVADIESPATVNFNPPQQYQQPFHQQVPVQVNGNNYAQDGMLHTRNASYPSQASTGTPLSQIPERAIHAQPFQPNPYQQPANFYPQPYQVMPPNQGYYYPPTYNHSMSSAAGAAAFVPQQQAPAPPAEQQTEGGGQAAPPNLVAQEVNGMVYYYDAAQIPAVATFPAAAYQAPPPYPMGQMGQLGGVVGMGGMMTPSPDGFYYPSVPAGAVYYPQ